MERKRKRRTGVKIVTAIAVCLAAVLLLRFYISEKKVEYRTLRVSNYGYTETRLASLEKAVERFNASHSDVQYMIEFNHYMDGVWDWDRYNDMTEEFLQDGEGWDIFTVPGEYIGRFAAGGYLLPLDDVVEDPRYKGEYFSPLVPKTKFLGHTWGVLIEMDLRAAYFNKEVLRGLGYSESEGLGKL